MSSLRHFSLPGAIILLATLVLRVPTPEAEWLLASLLHLRRRLDSICAGSGLCASAPQTARTIHIHEF